MRRLKPKARRCDSWIAPSPQGHVLTVQERWLALTGRRMDIEAIKARYSNYRPKKG